MIRFAEEGVRADLLVHALSQLADAVSLELPADIARRARLEQLIAAYAIGNRVVFSSSARHAGETSFVPLGQIVNRFARPEDPPASLRPDDRLLAAKRVALVTNIPAHYRIQLFNGMSDRLARVGGALKVFFINQDRARSWMDGGSDWRFEAETLKQLVPPLRSRRPGVPFNLEARLRAFRPDVMLTAGMAPHVTGRVLILGNLWRIPSGIISGDIAWSNTARSAVRAFQRKHLVRLADFAIAYGSAAGEYLHSLRPELPLVHGRNSSPFDSPQGMRPLRSDPVELITVGDLSTPRKGIDILIDALLLRPQLPCRLTVVGGGALLDELRDRATSDERIRLLGPQSPGEVRARYAASDAFLFATRSDVFGLACLEAMGSGLATATSRSPGASWDLAVHERTALVVEDDRPATWAQTIERLVFDDELRRRLAAAGARTVASRWTMDHQCDAWMAGLRLGVLTSSGSTGPRRLSEP
jgi:glycosyltransferase involved in cell wall biosynthesis